MKVFVEQVAVATPGMQNWQQAQKVLAGEAVFDQQPLEKYKPTLLPPNERRRATDLIRLAFNVCEQIAATSEWDFSMLPSIFATSGGDYQIIDQICSVVTAVGDRMVSPTQFHNSVHNAAAGYWSIATADKQTSISLSGGDDTFAMGLIEACTLLPENSAQQSNPAVLLISYDSVPPPPLFEKRPIVQPFACALLLTREPSENSVAELAVELVSSKAQKNIASTMSIGKLENLRLGNPAARSLPLLQTLALKNNQELRFKLPGNQRLQVTTSFTLST